MEKEIHRQSADSDVDDIEDEAYGADEQQTLEDLYALLGEGLLIVRECPDLKWEFIKEKVVDLAGEEKIVFFAQPIETVTTFVNFLKREYGEDVSVIIGGQSDAERSAEVEKFLKPDGARFLVSSKAGGEGINLQVARRLVHIDVPWNPMDMEQRVGRVHRFGSRRNIVVDTIVVKDSREEHAYRAAREKLRLIASTLVTPERFEALFSRVICLLPSEELQHLLIADDLGPLSHQNEQQLAQMVREGYERWQAFDSKYAEQQRQIRAQNPGIAAWDDLRHFMLGYSKTIVEEGFFAERFELDGDCTKAVQTASPVLKLSDDSLVACQDLGGLPAYGPNGQIAWQFGINHPLAMSALVKAAFEKEKVGPAFIRWSRDREFFDKNVHVTVLAFLRLTLRADENRGWQEYATALRLFAVNSSGESRGLSSEESRVFFSGLYHATVRSKVPGEAPSCEELCRLEQEIAEQLRRPSTEDIQERKRHAVASIFVGIVEKQ
ncbi:prophage LambdaMc01, helicase, SNF2 family protein [Blastopirellula marina DSM 3645]|uniref:Prophage LambdaMc01, helicase, SNF2 family protein n=2 Tax=Blastopirellula marina TaxID=124 RepID=A3ZSD9_9BACT|nr:prophage LambdaMc01, helicase, SNF2 family protein [Blastopirellula marina DSM 3645]